jgi:hypothetical protein
MSWPDILYRRGTGPGYSDHLLLEKMLSISLAVAWKPRYRSYSAAARVGRFTQGLAWRIETSREKCSSRWDQPSDRGVAESRHDSSATAAVIGIIILCPQIQRHHLQEGTESILVQHKVFWNCKRRDQGRFAKIKDWRPYASSGAVFNFALISIRD